MRKRTLLTVVSLLALILVVVVGMSACGGSDTTTTVTTAATGQTETAQPPTTEPPATHKPVALEIYALPFGKAGYVLSFALADLINKNSDWLRAVSIESPSSAANLNILQRSPEKSGVWIGYCNPASIYYSTKGGAPFTPEKPFTMDVKAIAKAATISAMFLTTDPNLKTPQDLIGKTIALEPAGSTEEFVPRFMLQAWGIYDKVKIVTMGFSDQSAALPDGTIDVGRSGAVLKGTGEYSDWAPIAPFEQLLTARKTYVFPTTADDYALVRKQTGYPIYPIGAIGKTVGKSTLPDFLGEAVSNGWFVSADMPDDVVTEIERIIYENADKFVTYHADGAGITPKTVGGMMIPRDGFHPAAIKFLEEKGVKVGL